MNLKPPQQDSLMIRRLLGLDKKNKGDWHFSRNGGRKTVCGNLISRLYDVETFTLGEIEEGKVCKVCYPYGV